MALPDTPSAPVIKQGWMRAVVFLIAYLATCIAAAGISSSIWENRTGWVTDSQIEISYFGFLVLGITSGLTILITVLFRLYIDRRSLLSLGFQWKGFEWQAPAGLLTGMLLTGAASLVLYLTHDIWWTFSTWDPAAFRQALALLAFAALAEECVFRGYILNNLMDSMDRWTALVISTILFALVHLGNLHLNAIAVVNLLAGGFLLGINYIHTRNLWFSILFHFSWNFCQGPLLGYEVSGLSFNSFRHMEHSNNTLMAGGGFGLEGSIIATLLLVAAILCCQLYQQRRSRQ